MIDLTPFSLECILHVFLICIPKITRNWKGKEKKMKEKKKDNEEWTRKMRLLGVNLNLFPEIAALVHKVSDEWQKGPQI